MISDDLMQTIKDTALNMHNRNGCHFFALIHRFTSLQETAWDFGDCRVISKYRDDAPNDTVYVVPYIDWYRNFVKGVQ